MSRRGPGPAQQGRVVDLAHDGRGVVKPEGKAMFVPDALPGELIEFRRRRRRRSFDEGELLQVIEPSPQRVVPRCPHFGRCGGCSLQHLLPEAQLGAKQKQLEEAFRRVGEVTPLHWLEPLTGPHWGYRRKARLGVKWVHAKARVLVGFRERLQPYIADMDSCEVLDARVAALLPALADTIAGLRCRERLPQIEVAAGDDAVALVFRHLDPLAPEDRAALAAFGRTHGVWPWLQPGGLDTVQPLLDDTPALEYALPDFDLQLRFLPTDFVQVNAGLNRRMVNLAVELLAPADGERVLELFSGLGNFSLPLARRGARVVAVEGDAALVARGRDNAERNGLSIEYHVADLAEVGADAPWLAGGCDKLLLDPARAGADGALPAVLGCRPQRIVYVSCHPATLARDARIIIDAGYRLHSAGVMDMFPHTGHVESIALFVPA